MVILSQGRFPEILYIDGFAGPGAYEGGEAGSPIIALDTALGFQPPLTAKIHFLFVEERSDRCSNNGRSLTPRQNGSYAISCQVWAKPYPQTQAITITQTK